MVECTNLDLLNLRNNPKNGPKMPRWLVYQKTGISPDVLKSWEDGISKPDPDEVDRLGKLYGDPTLWHRWMMSNYESYRDRFSKATDCNGFSAAINSVRHELKDVLDLQDKVERDALDGKMDDPMLKQEYLKELKEAGAAINRARDLIKGPGNE